jgi:hypothetical protein
MFGGGGGGRPGGNPLLLIGLLVIAVLCIGPFLLFNGFGGGDDGGGLPAVVDSVNQFQGNEGVRPPVESAPSGVSAAAGLTGRRRST